MNHQPFREWLLSKEKLSADQTQSLQDHLHSCDSCTQIKASWLEVESVFHKTPQVIPESGFTARWQAHLLKYQQNIEKRKAWMTIGITALIVTILVGILVTQVWLLIQSPGPYLITWFNRLLGLVPIYYAFQDLFRSLLGGISINSFVGMFFLVGIISFMSVLWLSAYRKFSMARRFA